MCEVDLQVSGNVKIKVMLCYWKDVLGWVLIVCTIIPWDSSYGYVESSSSTSTCRITNYWVIRVETTWEKNPRITGKPTQERLHKFVSLNKWIPPFINGIVKFIWLPLNINKYDTIVLFPFSIHKLGVSSGQGWIGMVSKSLTPQMSVLQSLFCQYWLNDDCG